MKNILIISGIFLFFAGSQICGCGNSCSTANAQTNNVLVSKTEKLKIVKLKITGMTCAGCSNHVTQTLQSVKGVSKVELEYPGDVATIEFDATKTKTEDLIAAVEKINYKAEVVTDKSTSNTKKTKSCAASCGH